MLAPQFYTTPKKKFLKQKITKGKTFQLLNINKNNVKWKMENHFDSKKKTKNKKGQ